ncbi:MAG: hypothetical protein GWN84_02665 [Gammaproteobacteria bacterium]|nr:hypothetical protein [Gammaproteobacteria bacterium]NIR82055.1 hypothetical protein [Gammaproteobacteria bacterium]NIR89283.1 hypothetical protein [Gammaproteobacteria bacterium]NIU03165.1 hypothetical protein [Gammaproteobacteria bacterium]NIV50681.1 hypothetical protein [Gammaproteobacteria bacterium]
MALLERIDGPLPDRERAEHAFAGRLLVFTDVPSLRALCARLDARAREALGGLDPQTAQFELGRDTWLARIDPLQRSGRRDPALRHLFTAALAEVGVDAQRTYADKLTLRVVPHGTTHGGGRHSMTAVHRDTWGSNLRAQINWWTPIYALSSRRTIAFYPGYWSRPVANTSDAWDFDELLACRRDGRPYPTVPEPTEPVDPAAERRIVIEPGELLCFSGAHLHASVSNDSARTRFSLETRTVNLDDLRAERGAPNVDGLGTKRMFRWFARLSDGAALSAAMESA